MDILIQSEYDQGFHLRDATLRAVQKWEQIAENIKRIGNSSAQVMPSSNCIRLSFVNLLSFEKITGENSQLVGLSVTINDNTFKVIVDPTKADHLWDTLRVSGKGSLSALSAFEICNIVQTAFDRLLVYCPD